jgi:hypothetical protein
VSHDGGEPDPFVRTALELLPVPDHREGFWSELEVLLDAEPTRRPDQPRSTRPGDGRRPAAAVERRPAPVLELAPEGSAVLVPATLRRRSNVVLTAVAAAAAVVVVVAGSALVRQRAEGRVGTTAVADGPAEQQTLISSTSTSTSITGPDAAAPTEAVMAWLADLSEGDTTSAWAALAPGSRAHFGSRSAFAAQGSSLAEGYGAWASAHPDDVLVTSLGPDGPDDVVVVTLVGTVNQEGTTQHRADAFPVRMVDGIPRLEPYAFAGELEIVVPEGVPAGGTRPIVPTDQDIVIVVPRGVEAPVLRLDDGEVVVCGQSEGTELTELDDAPGQRCSYHPEGGLEPGTRVLTVAFTNPDRTGIAAASVLFEAA